MLGLQPVKPNQLSPAGEVDRSWLDMYQEIGSVPVVGLPPVVVLT